MNIRTYKIIILTVIVATILLNLISCSKYEEGPSFSLKTKTSRLIGVWEFVLDDSSTNETDHFVIEFKEDGGFTMDLYSDSVDNHEYCEGVWEWKSNKEIVEVNLEEPNFFADQFEWEIVRLTNNEFWCYGFFSMLYKWEKKN